MALKDLVTSLLSNTDWMAEATKAVTLAESLGPVLVKVAMDASAGGPTSILKIIEDVDAALPAVIAAISANNTEVVAAPAPDPSTNGGAA